jgi:hypothetical protein
MKLRNTFGFLSVQTSSGGGGGVERDRDLKLTTHLDLMPRRRMVELYFISPYVFMAWRLIIHRDNFTLHFLNIQYFV